MTLYLVELETETGKHYQTVHFRGEALTEAERDSIVEHAIGLAKWDGVKVTGVIDVWRRVRTEDCVGASKPSSDANGEEKA